MGKLKRTGILKSIFNGVLDVIKVTPIVAPFSAAIDAVKNNVDSPEGGEKQLDWIRIGVMVGIVAAVIGFIFNAITIEELKEIIKIIY